MPRNSTPSTSPIYYDYLDTPIGQLLLAARPDAQVLAIKFSSGDAIDAKLAQHSSELIHGGTPLDPLRTQLTEYFAGQRSTFDLELDFSLTTEFQQSVLTGLAKVPFGQTTSYGQLAQAIGRPTAARAVGSALRTNPICVVLPCHRVLGASGALTGFAGGMAAKRILLELEGG